jgi:dihydrofolate reductase
VVTSTETDDFFAASELHPARSETRANGRQPERCPLRHNEDHDLAEDMTTSRSLISAMQATLDGYSSEGDAEWVNSRADGLELLPPVDPFVLGGGMFPDYERFCATMLDDPSVASEMLGRDVYCRELAYARLAAETPHLVLSTTLTDASWPTARIVHDISEIRTLKQQPGKAVYVVGGPGLVASLINDSLLDELRLIAHEDAAN